MGTSSQEAPAQDLTGSPASSTAADVPPTSPGLHEKPIVGYSDPWNVAPGDRISFMVSTSHPAYEARLVRLRHGDSVPGAPGLRYEVVDSDVAGTHPGRDQPIRLGSYIATPHAPDLEPDRGFTIQAWVYPTTLDRGLQGIVTKWSEPEQAGYGLFLEPGGSVSLRLDDEVHACPEPLRPFEWAFVAASWDAETGEVRVQQTPLTRVSADPSACEVRATAGRRPSPSGAPLVLGGHTHASGPVGQFNGKVDSPRVFGRRLSESQLAGLSAGAPPPEGTDLLVAWNLAADTDSLTVRDESGRGHEGQVRNHPTRGVTGRNWTGHESAHHRAESEYNAAFFHEDDLEDAEWEPDFTLSVPEDLRSGVYAVHLSAGDDEDWIPFFVRPPAGTTTAPIAFLAPTLSYLAYANEHSAADNPVAAVGDLTQHYGAADRYAIAVPVCGLYDHHPDGTGFCYSSWRRPIVNMRPDYRMPLVQSAHQLSADLHLVDWLEAKEFPYDVVTDHDLHHEGTGLLAPYRVVVTGSHPEYWTEAMLDGLQGYLEGGGRLMYMGGNGFYWVTSISPSRPHLIEVRRGRRGTGTWRSDPGEDYHSTTGELGGLWRDRGRAPQRLVGVGMAAQGFDRALPYHRTAASREDEVSWVFDGVESDVIGAEGLVMGGAAGLEVDRMDVRLGTLPNAVLLATASGFSDSYQHVVEEVDSSDSRQGGTVSPHVRADMVYSRGTGGSEVFSTGSISWCGSLSHNDYDNDVSRITENVLHRFLRESPCDEH